MDNQQHTVSRRLATHGKDVDWLPPAEIVPGLIIDFIEAGVDGRIRQARVGTVEPHGEGDLLVTSDDPSFSPRVVRASLGAIPVYEHASKDLDA